MSKTASIGRLAKRGPPRSVAPRLSYTLQELSATTGVSIPTLRRRAKEGLLRTFKVGGRRLACGESAHELFMADEPKA